MVFPGQSSWRSFLRTCGQLLLVTAAVARCAHGQSDTAADKGKLLTPEASLNLRSIADLQYSPDRTRLAFVVTEPAKGTGRCIRGGTWFIGPLRCRSANRVQRDPSYSLCYVGLRVAVVVTRALVALMRCAPRWPSRRFR